MVHLPGMNTPQFDWVKSRLPRRAQPVPPVYQPEVAARAILLAADTGRREIYVGLPTAEVIIGNKWAPGLGDWYLARTGYRAQQTNEPEDPNRPNNLWEPVPGDHGAHGTFDSRAHPQSVELWAATKKTWIGLALLGAGALTYALTNRFGSREETLEERYRRAA